uniref:PQQ-binding-like beta-propeller repeat protein n=1 Tax=Marinobacter daqiaonensis TaxID=650891 RepID=UPI001432CBCA
MEQTFQTGGAIDSSPTIAGNVVYFGSDDNIVYALSIESSVDVSEPSGLGLAMLSTAALVLSRRLRSAPSKALGRRRRLAEHFCVRT